MCLEVLVVLVGVFIFVVVFKGFEVVVCGDLSNLVKYVGIIIWG